MPCYQYAIMGQISPPNLATLAAAGLPDWVAQSGNPGLGVRAHKGVLQVKGVGVNMWMMWSSH